MPEPDTIPVSASVASTGKGIRYIGNHCYAYAGEHTANTTTATLLDFTTGSGYIVGEFRLAGFADMGSPATGALASMRVKFNGITVLDFLTEGYDPTNSLTYSNTAKTIIPPLTHVVCEADSNTTSSGVDGTISFIGRVYGAE